eukprot:g1509.t1
MVEEAGFGRAEMNSEKLAGTVKGFQRHIFLTWGLATEWPEDPFEKQYKGMLAEELLKLNEVPAMRIRKCSHVGGHKYAGNVLVYGRDTSHWYGYVTPWNLKGVLLGRQLRSRLWRGRLGITEQEAIQERRNQVLRDLLPAAALTAALLAFGYGWYRRRN